MLKRAPSDHGRLIPKPTNDKNSEEVIDEAPQSIQDQIENLRTKIFLKERYNQVLAYEISENREGAVSQLSDLHIETTELRTRLMLALNSEKSAVQHALRTHLDYQLAMSDRTSYVAIPWLEDVIFDLTKRFNELLNFLIRKRRKLEEAEAMIKIIEKWPRPGSLPWEVDAMVEFRRIENRIENMKVKVETAQILYSKYNEIKYILREESGKYRPVLEIQELQFRMQQKELSDLKKMLREAIVFKDDAEKTLSQTEKEASENRRERRRQMNRVKKAVEKMLLDNQRQRPPPDKPKSSATVLVRFFNAMDMADPGQAGQVTESMLKQKRAKIEDLQAKVKKLVEVMRVHSIDEIPGRLKIVSELSKYLDVQIQSKSRLKDLLLLQKGHLFLIQCQLKFTGKKKDDRFFMALENLKKQNTEIVKEIEQVTQTLGVRGNTIIQIRLGIIACVNLIQESRGRRFIKPTDMKAQMKFLYSRLGKLVKYTKLLKSHFPKQAETKKDYKAYIKAPPIQDRFIRVGSPVVTENEESDEDEIIDSKIPGRLDIKFRSKQVIQKAIIRRGLK